MSENKAFIIFSSHSCESKFGKILCNTIKINYLFSDSGFPIVVTRMNILGFQKSC